MPKSLMILFSVFWFAFCLLGGFCVVCAHIFQDKKIFMFQTNISFKKVLPSYKNGKITIQIFDLYSKQHHITINKLTHTLQIHKILFPSEGGFATIEIDKMAARYESSLEDTLSLFSSNTSGLSTPTSLSIGSCDLTLPEGHHIHLKNLKFASFPFLQCHGQIDTQGLNLSFEIHKKPFHHLETLITWNLCADNKLANKIPYVHEINKLNAIEGVGKLILSPENPKFSSSFTIKTPKPIKGNLRWTHGRPITLSFPHLLLSEANFLSKNTIHKFTVWSNWSLKDVVLYDTSLAVMISPSWSVDEDSLQIESKLKNGIVFVKNVLQTDNIEGHFSLKNKKLWHVNVKKASTANGINITGNISYKGAHLHFDCGSDVFNSILEKLNLIPKSLLTIKQATTQGVIKFSTTPSNNWTHSIEGQVKSQGGNVAIHLPFFRQPILLSPSTINASVAQSVVLVHGQSLWGESPANINITWDKSAPEWHIKVQGSGFDQQHLRFLMQDALPNWGKGTCDIEATISVPFEAQNISLVGKLVSDKIEYKLPIFVQPILIQQANTDLLFPEKGPTQILSLKIQGPDVAGNLKGSFNEPNLTLSLSNVSFWESKNISGLVDVSKNQTEFHLTAKSVDWPFIQRWEERSPSNITRGFLTVQQVSKNKSTASQLKCHLNQHQNRITFSGSFDLKGSSYAFSSKLHNLSLEQFTLKGKNLFALSDILGVDFPCETESFAVTGKMSEDDSMDILLDATTVTLNQIPPSSLTKGKTSLVFNQGHVQGSFADSVAKLQSLSLSSDDLSLIVLNGVINLKEGFLRLPGHLEPAPIVKKGSAALTPDVASILCHKIPSLPNVFWHFNFKKEWNPHSLKF